jgi:hypothetical protein
LKTQHKKHHEGQASALPGGGIHDTFDLAARARIAVAARTISSAKVVGWFACVEVVVEDVLLHEIYNVRSVFELKAARSTSTRSSSIGAVPALTSRAAPSKKVVSNKVRLSIFLQSSFSVVHAPFQARALCVATELCSLPAEVAEPTPEARNKLKLELIFCMFFLFVPRLDHVTCVASAACSFLMTQEHRFQY